MNVKDFKEIVEASNYISSVGEYVIRKFKTSDNYILIDKIGDFIVIECYRKLDGSTFTDVFDDIFLKKYLIQLIKRQWDMFGFMG